MPAPDTLQTERLSGERRRASDFDDLHRLYSDPRVSATLAADGQPFPEEKTRQVLQASVEHWESHGFGIWNFRHKDDGRFVGYCGVRQVTIDGEPEVELLYAVRAEDWDRGYASEMAKAVIGVGFEALGFPNLVSFTLPTNRDSRRVMEKQGFRYEKDITHAGLVHVLYRLTAAEWRRERGG
ncbi:MAG TPA: GNAT family N-acetyltransferase [Myxococcaceae bacterium]|nr:GNAT family N-acetyltransferase [Myxococcaceae bacterium]